MSYIYFDNAATTYKKPREALRRTLRFIRRGYGNAGRSGHKLSIYTAEEIFETRETICEFLSFEKVNGVVFSHNATHALNQAIKGLIPKGAHVLCSSMEHNSVLRPLFSMERNGEISLSFFSHIGDVEKNIREKLTPQTKAIVSSLASNVTGEEISLSMLSRLRKEKNLIVIVDASQLFAHKKIDFWYIELK